MIYTSLNTILQLLCAIYITIVFDNILFRRFWTPDYYNILETHISSYKLPIDKNLKSWTSNIQEKNRILEDNIRKRGTIFLCNTFFIMCMIAIFDQSAKHTNELSIIFLILFIVSYIIYTFTFVFNIRWRYLIPILILEYLVFIPIHFFTSLSIDLTSIAFKARFSIVVLSICPICLQIALSWLYSTAIHAYIISKLNVEADDYLQAKRALQQRDRNSIPSKYQVAFLNFVFSETKEDTRLTEINDFLVDKINTIFDQINVCQLIKAYVNNPNVTVSCTDMPLNDENQSVKQINPLKKVQDLLQANSENTLFIENKPTDKDPAGLNKKEKSKDNFNRSNNNKKTAKKNRH